MDGDFIMIRIQEIISCVTKGLFTALKDGAKIPLYNVFDGKRCFAGGCWFFEISARRDGIEFSQASA